MPRTPWSKAMAAKTASPAAGPIGSTVSARDVGVMAWPPSVTSPRGSSRAAQEGHEVEDVRSERDEILAAAAMVALAAAVDRERRADLAGLHQPLQLQKRRGVPGRVGQADPDAVLLRQRDRPIRLGQRHRERLLEIDVAPRRGDPLDLLQMVIGMAGAEHHDVGRLGCQHRVDRAIVRARAGVGQLLVELLQIGVHVGDHLDVRQPMERAM